MKAIAIALVATTVAAPVASQPIEDAINWGTGRWTRIYHDDFNNFSTAPPPSLQPLDFYEIVVRGEGRTVQFRGDLRVDCSAQEASWQQAENFYNSLRLDNIYYEVEDLQYVTDSIYTIYCSIPRARLLLQDQQTLEEFASVTSNDYRFREIPREEITSLSYGALFTVLNNCNTLSRAFPPIQYLSLENQDDMNDLIYMIRYNGSGCAID